MMSFPSASGELFSSFIVSLHTTHLMRSISGLLSSLPAVLISSSPSASTCATWPPQSSTGKHDCGPLPHCASSALPSPRHLLPTTLVLEGAGLPQAPRAGFWPSLLLLRLQPHLDQP